MPSPSVSSRDATADEAGSSPAAIESTDGESSVAEEVSDGAQRDVKAPAEDEESSGEVETRDFKGRRKQKERRVIAGRRKAYSHLLDGVVADANAVARYDVEGELPLGESRVGASVWTRGEKEVFFGSLTRYGFDDLPRIARSLDSKSELEVRSYLLALQDGLQDEPISSGAASKFSRVHFPAAREVGSECEAALEVAANVAARSAEDEAARTERKRFGDAWLIDAGSPEAMDSEEEASAGERPSGTSDEQRPATTPTTAAADLLDTSMLLQLSRSLFMNGPADGPWNYRTVELLGQEPEGSPQILASGDAQAETPTEPAIFCSALLELQSIARTVTQKLVHATLFQATSRLRAKDDRSPAPVVLASDVYVAAEILGLRRDWKTYWAKLPRRTGLEVYSESDKYRRGRVGTKNGVKLTYEEVETELGLPTGPVRSTEKKSQSRGTSDVEEDVGDLITGSESDASESDVSSDGIIEVQAEKDQRKRRRRLSPDSFARAEERYLRAMDVKADRVEDGRLRELLGLEDGKADVEDAGEVLERPKLKKRLRMDADAGWRESIEGMAPWEVECVRRRLLEQDDSESDEDITRDDRSSTSTETGEDGAVASSSDHGIESDE